MVLWTYYCCSSFVMARMSDGRVMRRNVYGYATHHHPLFLKMKRKERIIPAGKICITYVLLLYSLSSQHCTVLIFKLNFSAELILLLQVNSLPKEILVTQQRSHSFRYDKSDTNIFDTCTCIIKDDHGLSPSLLYLSSCHYYYYYYY